MKPSNRALLICLLSATAGCGAAEATPPADPTPVGRRDWTWVQGAVFVPTNCVNEAQQWDEYDPAVNDRELHYASAYGINMVRVYLHYYVYLKKRDLLLADIGDFLGRADKYGIRTEFVFFDDCWNEPPDELLSPGYRYPAPLRGVHNSQWLVCPGGQALDHYEQHRARLKAYVQDIVVAHRADPRVAFWETYNEPKKAASTVRLERDALAWIRETGTKIPVTATGGDFSGGPFSDFPSWHEYGGYAVLGDGRSLCTECMNRQGQTVAGIVEHFRGKVGYIMWEFGIGRDNCRFAWDENRGKPRGDETPKPFHGIVYPDGHPWSLADARALLGREGFARARFFTATYYRDDSFSRPAKTSVTPMIDFDLGDEEGTGSPDASAGVPKDNFSIQYAGAFTAPDSGSYTFSADCDGRVQVLVDGRPVVDRQARGRLVSSGATVLEAGRTYPITVRYAHATGRASLHLSWSGPTFANRILEPVSHPAGL
ncbi:MAG TPA: PA14 domain-containing protein [Opitutaceae bacterium]|nr:PA14 domain-containing protein [Opitutaceae bacterium]